jgi:hypothetical protein
VALAEVAGAVKDELFASAAGLVVMAQMMHAELEGLVGSKHAKMAAGDRGRALARNDDRLGGPRGRTVSAQRPRGPTAGNAEIALDTWKVFSSINLLNSLVVERMLAGVVVEMPVVDHCLLLARPRVPLAGHRVLALPGPPDPGLFLGHASEQELLPAVVPGQALPGDLVFALPLAKRTRSRPRESM